MRTAIQGDISAFMISGIEVVGPTLERGKLEASRAHRTHQSNGRGSLACAAIGLANQEPITSETALRLGRALAYARGSGRIAGWLASKGRKVSVTSVPSTNLARSTRPDSGSRSLAELNRGFPLGAT